MMMPNVSHANALDFAVKTITEHIAARRREIEREKRMLQIELKEIEARLEIPNMYEAVKMWQESFDDLLPPAGSVT